MRPPGFWHNAPDAPGVAARLLTPAAAVWAAVTRRRMARAALRVDGLRVICVGNLAAGGTGKTPVVCDLVQRLAAMGKVPHILSRGYGGSDPGPLRVDPARHGAARVGDEPLLLANYAPVWVSRDRVAGARAAQVAGADVVVMDDGFQNPDLHKDLSIIVVDAAVGFGNGRVIPAGPLREPVERGLARADMVIVMGSAGDAADLGKAWPPLQTLPTITASLGPLETGMDWQGLRLFAFAGIGRPEKFFATLRGVGADVVATRSFADHASYAPRIMARLRNEAAAAGAQLVTTEKDLVRLPADQRAGILPFPVRLQIDDAAPLEAALRS